MLNVPREFGNTLSQLCNQSLVYSLLERRFRTFCRRAELNIGILENPHLTLAYLTGVTQDQISQLFIANEARLKVRGDPSIQEKSLLEKKSEIWFSQLKVWRSFVDNQVYLVLVQEQENYELRAKMMNSQSEPHISLFSL